MGSTAGRPPGQSRTSPEAASATHTWRGLWAAFGIVLALGVLSAFWLAVHPGVLAGAEAAFEQGDYRSALRTAREQLNSRPGNAAASLLAARCLTRLARHAQAEEYYGQAGHLGLDDLHDRAYGLVLLDRREPAARLYEEILVQSPDDALALKRLAAVRIASKEWKKVLSLADRLITIPGNEIPGHTLAGIGHHESKHYSQAAESFLRVLALDPDLREMPLPRPLFWNNLALDLIGLGRTTEARGHLERALARDEDAGLMELLGLSFEHEGQVEHAERVWRKALEIDPAQANALLDLGRLALSRKKCDEAIPLLERAAEVSPDSLDPVYSLSLGYRLKGDLQKAEYYERRAEVLRKASPRGVGMGEMPEPETGAGEPTDRPGAVQ